MDGNLFKSVESEANTVSRQYGNLNSVVINSIVINDLPCASSLLHFLLLLMTNFLSHKSYETLFRLMNSELILVNNWFRNNRLSLNVSKTNYISYFGHIGSTYHRMRVY